MTTRNLHDVAVGAADALAREIIKQPTRPPDALVNQIFDEVRDHVARWLRARDVPKADRERCLDLLADTFKRRLQALESALDGEGGNA